MTDRTDQKRGGMEKAAVPEKGAEPEKPALPEKSAVREKTSTWRPYPPREHDKGRSSGKIDHAPAPDRSPRPRSEMGAETDRWAFLRKQARASRLEIMEATEADRREARVGRLHEAFARARDHAFYGERFEKTKEVGALSQHHGQTQRVGGVKEPGGPER